MCKLLQKLNSEKSPFSHPDLVLTSVWKPRWKSDVSVFYSVTVTLVSTPVDVAQT
jgi:hypothetical protein